MKTLELKQMELVKGEGCGVATGFAIGAIVLGLAGGPFTWWTVAAVVVEASGWTYGCMEATEW